MATKTKLEHNVLTGEVIERELNEQELAQLEVDLAAAKAKAEAEAAQAAAKIALLDRLGISAEEAKLLLS